MQLNLCVQYARIKRTGTPQLYKVMKLTVFLITLACLQVSAKVNAQISLSTNNTPLAKVINTIQQQSGYSFFYKHKLVENINITTELHNVTLQQALDKVLANQSLTYEVIEKTVVIKAKEKTVLNKTVDLIAVPITVSGRVTDSLGTPLIGATVAIKGSNAVITNDQGEFNINGKIGDQVFVTFVGYVPYSFNVSENMPFKIITLRASYNKLNEVVVSTGYEILPKERATGSFTTIDNQTLNEQVGTNILNRLNGVASSVLFPAQNIQNAPAFFIRGLSTINGPKQPLIILDNFPYDGDINNINPNDVENITILKDAAAASIWGTRAGNGVVVITTKKGHINQPLSIGFNSDVLITQKPDLNSLRTISSSDYIDLERTLFGNGYYDSYLNNSSMPAVSPVVELLAKQRAELITATDATNQINAFRSIDSRDQFSKYVYQQAVTQQYNLNLSGGGNNISYYLSGGYDKNNDQLGGINDRLTFRSSNTYRPAKNLQLTVGFQYTQSTATSGKQGYGNVRTGLWQVPYTQLADANGNALPVALNYRSAYTDTVGKGKLLNWKYYPLDDWQHDVTNNNQSDLLANIGLNYKLPKGFNIDFKYLYERQNLQSNELKDPQSYADRSLINQFTQINSGVVNHIVPLGSIYNTSSGLLESNDLRGQLGYNYSAGKHEIAIIAGSEIRQAHTTGSQTVAYGYNSAVLTTTPVDFVNTYPSIIDGSYSSIPYSLSFSDLLNRYVSVYGNGSYTYDHKYTFSASARRDASNLFGASTNNRWTPLWSAGGSWLISDEAFYHSQALPYLKLRATYGYSGNVDPTKSAVTTLIYNTQAFGTNYNFTRVDQFPNPDLRWEKVRIINVGLDFHTKGNVVSGSLEAYLKTGTDLFGAAPFDPTAALNFQSTLVRNIADMRGKGIDLTLSTQNLTGAVKWNTSLLFSYNRSITTNYYRDTTTSTSNYVSDGSSTLSPLTGQDLYSIVAYKWAGLDGAGNPQGYLNGKISEDYYNIINTTKVSDLVYKPSTPVFFGSINNTFDYKGFNLAVNITYRLGYYFKKPSVYYSSLISNGSSVGTADYANRWKVPGDEKNTNVPSFIYPDDSNRDLFYNFSDVLIEKADNIKLQFVNVGYDLARLWHQRNGIKTCQVYFNASNLGTIWRANKDGIDPDYAYSFAQRKTFAIGLRANF